MRKIKTYAIAVLTLLIISLIPLSSADDFEPLASNNIYFADATGDTDIDVTIGGSFRFDIWTDVNQQIETVAVKNVSYLPAGIINYTSNTNTNRGTLLIDGYNDGYETFYKRPGLVEIHDSAGWTGGATNHWLWAVSSMPPNDYSVNNTDEQTFNVTWDAVGVGIATFTVQPYLGSWGGTAYNGTNPGTSYNTGTVTVHPAATTSFDAAIATPTTVDLSWTKGNGADRTVILGSEVGYPTDPTSGSPCYNNTGTATTVSVGVGETWYYSVWSYTNGIWSLTYQTDTVTSNAPPVFGTPNPINGSAGNALSLTWSISITDPELDTIAWTIQCSNGQATSGAGGGGLKSLSIGGLDYSTTYTVWVNATDAGSGFYTREWFTFDTKANTPIDVNTPSPPNGTIDTALAFTWSVDIDDTPDDNGKIDYRISCSNGQFTDVINANPGTKSLALSGLSLLTTYTVWVNATDGLTWDREWYTFTTTDNNPPTFGTPSPTNGSINQNLALAWGITITDPDADTISWTIDCSNSQSTSGGGTSPQAASISLTGLSYSTTYTVWVNATDAGGSGLTSRAWYTFTTKANNPPNIPTVIFPADEATNVKPNVNHLNVFAVDPDGHTMTAKFYWGNGTLIGTNLGVPSGSVTSISVPLLAEYTLYEWYVNLTDQYGAYRVTPTYNFTTGEKKGGQAPGTIKDLLVLVLVNYEPIPGAIITIYNTVGGQAVLSQTVGIAASDPEGAHEFSLNSGTYSVTVSAPGYTEQTQTVTLLQDAAIVFNLEPTGIVGVSLTLLIIILLIIAFLITYLAVMGKISVRTGRIFELSINTIAILLAIVTMNWILFPIGVILLFVEFLWLRGR